jgi:hypothetical protein
MVLSRPFNRRIAQTLDANPAWQPNTRDDSTPCRHAATRCVQHTHRLVMLDRGRIVEQGSHDALFRQPLRRALAPPVRWLHRRGSRTGSGVAPGNARLLQSCKLNKGTRNVACL